MINNSQHQRSPLLSSLRTIAQSYTPNGLEQERTRRLQLFPSVLVFTGAQDELFLRVSSDDLICLLKFRKSSSLNRESFLRDLSALDLPGQAGRFEVYYALLSALRPRRTTVITTVAEGSQLPTSSTLFGIADAFEREVWDRYGIPFSGHPGLRRILTDYGFKGHPRRKDFPTTGYTEVRYDTRGRRVAYEPVSLAQAPRLYTLETPQ